MEQREASEKYPPQHFTVNLWEFSWIGAGSGYRSRAPYPGSNRGFRPSEYVVPLLLLQHGENRELKDFQKLRCDKTVADILKM